MQLQLAVTFNTPHVAVPQCAPPLPSPQTRLLKLVTPAVCLETAGRIAGSCMAQVASNPA